MIQNLTRFGVLFQRRRRRKHELRKGLSVIRKVCAVPENVKMLCDLKWAYEHMEDLPDEEN